DAGEVVAAAAREHPEDSVRVPERAGDRTHQPISAERGGDPPVGGGLERELDRVLEAPGRLDDVLDPARDQRLGDRAEAAARTAAAGRRVDDHRQAAGRRRAHQATTSSCRSRATATGAGSEAAPASSDEVTPVSTIAASSPAAAAPARSESSRS